MIQERRQHQRLVPDSPAPIFLSDFGSVQLVDISEGGVGVGCPVALTDTPAISLAFDLPGGGAPIRATAEPAWSDTSRRRAGFRFLELSGASRLQLRDWISARAYDAMQTPLAFPALQPAAPAATDSEPIVADPAPSSSGWHGQELASLRAALAASSQARVGRLRRAITIGAAVVVFAPACVFLGHLLGNMGRNIGAPEITPIAKADSPAPKSIAASAQPSIAQPSAAPEQVLPARLSLDRPGFVLQVAAMTHEAFANDMRDSLDRKDFPAFVFRHSTGRFYFVAVGPFGNAAAAAKTQDKLRALGFRPILRPWSPE